MKELENIIKELIELMGFNDFSINYEENSNRFLIFINDGDFLKRFLPNFVINFNHLINLVANRKGAEGIVFIDINNYRREREDLILELARAAARKAITTQEEVALPAMNAYERRLVHLELAPRPDIKSESVGEGKSRYVVIRPILE